MRTLSLLLLFVGGIAAAPAEYQIYIQKTTDATVPDWARGVTVHMPLVSTGAAKEFAYSDPAVWKIGKDQDGKGFLELNYDRKAYKSRYTPKHRSPIHIALFQRFPAEDIVMDLEVMSTTEPYGHQDVCLFFGVESPNKYYYAHLAPAPDANAHNIFLVNNAARKNLLEPQKKGIVWKKDTWHKVRLARRASTGLIEVYLDDLKKPVLKAEDKTIGRGWVGFGSFDDTARFRNFTIHAKQFTIFKGEQLDFFQAFRE